jgi:glutamate-1-semialdehyde aminotransferase
VVLLPFNDLEAVRRALWLHGHEIAAVILEPIHYNGGCIVPDKSYLHALQDLCRQHGVRELWSADRDFGRFQPLRVRNPLVG